MTIATRSRLIIVMGGVGVVLFFLHLLGALTGIEGGIMRGIAGPEAGIASSARSLRQLISAPFRLGPILDENASLKKERDALIIKAAEAQRVQSENESLRTALKFAKRSPKVPTMAHVLAAEPDPGLHTILLDKGSKDGIGLEDPVLAEDGIVVGKIFKVDESTSIALLLTDTRSRIGGSIDNKAKTQGIIQGLRGLSLDMQLIPQNEEIAPGDMVVTSGIEPLVPEGLVIGRVQEVSAPERNPFKTATVVSPVDYDRINIVGILTP